MKKKHPGLPFYLLGHSMGSLIARAYLKKIRFYIRRIDYIRMPCLCTRL